MRPARLQGAPCIRQFGILLQLVVVVFGIAVSVHAAVASDHPPTNVRAEPLGCVPGEEVTSLATSQPLTGNQGYQLTFLASYEEEQTYDQGGENWAEGIAVVSRVDRAARPQAFRIWSSNEYIISLDNGQSLRVSIERGVATLIFRTWLRGCRENCPEETHSLAVNADGIIIFDGEVVGGFEDPEGG